MDFCRDGIARKTGQESGQDRSMTTPADREESTASMEPLLFGESSRWRSALHDKALELVAASTRLDQSLPQGSAAGLARNESASKDCLKDCDQHRHGDLDGRGALSEEALAGFIDFFLAICVDQVTFMEQLIQPTSFVGRVIRWADEEVAAGRLAARSDRLLEAVMIRGELERGDIENLLGTSERTARRVTSALLAQGALVSDSPRSRLRLGFPVKLAHHWLPGLFPQPLTGGD